MTDRRVTSPSLACDWDRDRPPRRARQDTRPPRVSGAACRSNRVRRAPCRDTGWHFEHAGVDGEAFALDQPHHRRPHDALEDVAQQITLSQASETIHRAQQMVLGDAIFEPKLVKQSTLIPSLPPHHGSRPLPIIDQPPEARSPPLSSPFFRGHRSKPTFALRPLSGSSGHGHPRRRCCVPRNVRKRSILSVAPPCRR
jgi:hypothetical protein